MKTFSIKAVLFITLAALVTGCARDLSSNVYTSDSTLSLTLEGQIVSVRPIIIKESDKLSDNAGGMLAGGAMGGVLGANAGRGNGQTAAIVGAAIAGAAIGTVVQGKLGEAKGFEYIIKVDTSKLKSEYYEGNAAMRSAISAATTSGLITVVQAANTILNEGQKVYVIFSDKRTRVIAAS